MDLLREIAHAWNKSFRRSSIKLRTEILAQADKLISRDRAETYGDALESFGRVAQIWTALKSVEFTSYDVALFMASLKPIRATDNPAHTDSLTDLIGYAALAVEEMD